MFKRVNLLGKSLRSAAVISCFSLASSSVALTAVASPEGPIQRTAVETVQSSALGSLNQPPVARIEAMSDRDELDVVMLNGSYGSVVYQVVGETAPRSLESGDRVVLRDLEGLVNISFYSQDGSLLKPRLQVPNSPDQQVRVMLRPTYELDADKSSLIISESGAIYLF